MGIRFLLVFLLVSAAPAQYQPPVTLNALFSQTQTVTVTGVTTETTLTGTGAGSLTIPANFFAAAGDTLHVRYQGTMTPGSSATLYTIKLKFGSTVIATGSGTPGANANTYGCEMNAFIVAQTVGSSGTVLVTGIGMHCTNAGDTVGDETPFTSTSPVTVDTTAAQTFNLTVTPGANAQSFTATALRLSRF